MRRKIITSIFLSMLFALIVVVIVIAGTTIDQGWLENNPQVGEANWIAWNVRDLPVGGGPPLKILTEDNTNSSEGYDGGYQDIYENGEPVWILQVQNFYDLISTPQNGDKINMIFGGLGNFSETLWEYNFFWDNSGNVSWTVHEPAVPVSTTMDDACPIFAGFVNEGNVNTGYFLGEPDTTYYIYRTQQGSGSTPPNGESGGRYLYLKNADSNELGQGSFTDNTYDPQYDCWYLVIKAGDATNPFAGCHSEPPDPTAVVVIDFEANFNNFDSSVMVSWETVSEIEVVAFNLLRSEGDPLDREVIANIPAEMPGSTVGHLYAYKDENVILGKEYYYWLELVGSDNQIIGPANVLTGHILYLPFLKK